MEDKFNEEDVKKFVNFLNTVAKKAEFKMDTQDIIKYFGLLSHMQQVIVPKLKANVLEVVAIHETDQAESEKGE